MKFVLSIIEILLFAFIMANISVPVYSVKWFLIVLSLLALVTFAFIDGLFRR